MPDERPGSPRHYDTGQDTIRPMPLNPERSASSAVDDARREDLEGKALGRKIRRALSHVDAPSVGGIASCASASAPRARRAQTCWITAGDGRCAMPVAYSSTVSPARLMLSRQNPRNAAASVK